MIKDKPIRIVTLFFIHILERYVLSHFKKVSFLGTLNIHPDKASLVLMNHYSFNDGFILLRLSHKILGKTFKVMVLETQLRAFRIIQYMGSFSINKKSRTMIESLNYAAELLKDSRNMLGIYPQGEVYSMHLDKIHFGNGIGHILKKSSNTPFQIIFGVTLLDYLDSFKPHARVYLEEYEGPRDVENIESAFNVFYQECKKKQQALHNPPNSVNIPSHRPEQPS